MGFKLLALKGALTGLQREWVAVDLCWERSAIRRPTRIAAGAAAWSNNAHFVYSTLTIVLNLPRSQIKLLMMSTFNAWQLNSLKKSEIVWKYINTNVLMESSRESALIIKRQSAPDVVTTTNSGQWNARLQNNSRYNNKRKLLLPPT